MAASNKKIDQDKDMDGLPEEQSIKGDILCKTHFFVAFICIFAYPECLPTP